MVMAVHCSPRSSTGALCDTAVLAGPQAFDLGGEHLAGLEEDLRVTGEADTAGRAGRDHVTGAERDDAGDVRDHGRHIEEQVARIRVLHDFAVHQTADRQTAPAGGQLVGCHQPRSERRGRLEGLP